MAATDGIPPLQKAEALKILQALKTPFGYANITVIAIISGTADAPGAGTVRVVAAGYDFSRNNAADLSTVMYYDRDIGWFAIQSITGIITATGIKNYLPQLQRKP